MDYKGAARLLAGWDNILILTHKRPDGDTIGCAAGLCRALRQMGKTAWVLENPDITALFTPYLEGLTAPAEFSPDKIVAVDVASVGLLPHNAKVWLDRGVDLAIDHHPSNEGFARENFVVADAAACGEVVYLIACHLGPITPDIAVPLYVAVSTDTGCFVYGNTTPQTHRVAASLMETGIAHQGLNKRHFRTKSLTRLALEAALLEEMTVTHGGMVAVTAVTLAMRERLGLAEEDLEDIAAYLGQIEGVKVSATIRELGPGECKISLRTDPNVLNATATCALLGGGGHIAASGATVSGSPDEARRAILDAIDRSWAK